MFYARRGPGMLKIDPVATEQQNTNPPARPREKGRKTAPLQNPQGMRHPHTGKTYTAG
jgi:hypothetical protein